MRIVLLLLVLALAVAGCGGSAPTASSPPSATAFDDIPGQALTNVFFGGGLWVAVGSNGTLLTSRDGRTWVRQRVPVDVNLRGVACGNGVWVAVGDAATIVWSEDGSHWTKAEVPVSGTGFRATTWGDGTFVAGAGGGVLLVSTDGRHWTQVDSGTSDILWGATFSSGLFVVTGQYGTILTSPDAHAWTGAHPHLVGRAGLGPGRSRHGPHHPRPRLRGRPLRRRGGRPDHRHVPRRAAVDREAGAVRLAAGQHRRLIHQPGSSSRATCSSGTPPAEAARVLHLRVDPPPRLV